MLAAIYRAVPYTPPFLSEGNRGGVAQILSQEDSSEA
jgi:hypothetical protein